MRHQSHHYRLTWKEGKYPRISIRLGRMFFDENPEEAQPALNLWNTETLAKGTPEKVYIDEMIVSYWLN